MNLKTTIRINDHDIELSNLDKVLYPKIGLTKADIISYYRDFAPRILPFYENRPLTMFRCPDGIEKEIFVQKNMPSYFPDWIENYKLKIHEGTTNHILVNNEATLIYLVNQACYTFHLTVSRIDKINHPDYLIFDLDPSVEDINLLKIVVNRVKNLLDSLDLKSFIQTTGSRGFHIYIPLTREDTFTRVRSFAKDVGRFLAAEYPQEITIEQLKAKRGKRVLIDYARNSYGMSNIAPYSLRTIASAPIATPLHWDELLDKNLNAQTHTIKNIYDRFKNVKDPWQDLNAHPYSIGFIESKLAALIK